MNKKLRVILVGCGYFGEKRLRACQRLSTIFSVVGIVDTDEKRAMAISIPLKIPHATSITDLLKEVAADVAIVSVPNKYHTPVVLEALKHHLHVLCEKPLAISSLEAKKIVNAAIRAGTFVKTGSNHRFFPTIRKAAEIIHEGKIGKILYVKGDIGTNGSHTKQSWFWDKKISGGGTFIDNACHLLDITRWFMGDFSSCIGVAKNVYWKQTGVEDVAGGIYQTKDNRIAVITSSWIQWKGYITLEIWGERGYLLIDSKRGDTLTYGEKGKQEQTIFDFSDKPLSSYDDELSYFAHCIQKNEEPKPNASDGARVIQMIEAVYASAKTQKHIVLGAR